VFYLIFRIHLALDRLEQEMTEVVRALALEHLTSRPPYAQVSPNRGLGWVISGARMTGSKPGKDLNVSKRWAYGTGIVLLCLALYHTLTLDRDAGVISDSAMYVILAEALASGRGYTEVSSAGDPVYVLAPPLFPLLLSSLVDFFGRNFVLMKTFVLLFAFAALWLIYVFVRARLGEEKALLMASVVGISPTFFSFSHKVMSDVPYLCLSLVALHFLNRYSQEERWVTASGVGALVFISLAYLTRSLGLALLLAAPLALVLHKPVQRLSYKLLAAGVFAVLCALPTLGWMARNAAVAQKATSISYANLFLANQEFNADAGRVSSVADLVPRLRHNLYAYGQGMATLIFPALLPTGHNLIAMAVAVPLFIGFLLTLWRGRGVAEIYVAFYVLVLLLFPTPVVPRYLLPLFPFLLLYLISGVEVVAGWLRKQLTATALAGLAVALLGTNLIAAASPRPEVPEAMEDYQKIAAWFKDQAAAGSIVMSRKPSLFYLWTGRKGALFPFTADSRRILRVICDRQVDYIVQDSFSPVTERYLMPVLARNGDAFARVYSRNNTHLFHVNRMALCQE
jgi:4-amino-4-deoxy-L-arabinose transferase-like glycosyltransferase